MSEFDINEGRFTNEENATEEASVENTLEEQPAPAEEVSEVPAEETAAEEAPAAPDHTYDPPTPEPIYQTQEPTPIRETASEAEKVYTAPQYQQPTYRQNPYNAQQPSQGYYQPYTNEYIYSPQQPKKKSNVGKAVLITIAAVLSVFVISIASVSAYNYYSLQNGTLRKNLFADDRGNPFTSADEKQEIDDHRNDEDDPQSITGNKLPDNAQPEDDPQNIATPTVIREFPTLEQLAAPEDAMSIPDIYDKVSPSVVGVSCSVRGGTQTGTGFVISEDGYIVTNAHVIENYISVMIVDSDLNEYEAEIIGSDSITDIAVLKIDPELHDLVPVEFGISGELRIGELAIAIGNPLGFELYGTMSTGIISGLDRTVTVEENTMNLLQTSATINPGNSGGPLLDAYGRVIGITSAKVDSTYGEGLGFAIPIDEAVPIIEYLIRYGYVPGRPSIGISGQDITELISMFYRLPKGVYVIVVTPDSGADRAGILAGDIIIGIQGESITTSDELNDIKNQYSVGDTVTLTIYRGGQNFDVDVVLTESVPDSTDDRIYPGE